MKAVTLNTDILNNNRNHYLNTAESNWLKMKSNVKIIMQFITCNIRFLLHEVFVLIKKTVTDGEMVCNPAAPQQARTFNPRLSMRDFQ